MPDVCYYTLPVILSDVMIDKTAVLSAYSEARSARYFRGRFFSVHSDRA
jgi:hypothetical protein